MSTEEILSDLKHEAFSGDLIKASTEKLNGYAAALCHSQAFSVFGAHEFPQVCETVRTHLLRAHIESLQSHVVELHNHITNLNEKNALTQKLVIVLTIVSIIGSAVQIWYAAKADEREAAKTSTVAAQPQPIQLPASAPTPAKPQANQPVASPATVGKAASGKP